MSDSESLKIRFLSYVRDNMRGPSSGNIDDVSALNQKERLELLHLARGFVAIHGLTLEDNKYKELLQLVFSLAEFKDQECLENEDLGWAFRIIIDDPSVREFARVDLDLLFYGVLAIAQQKIQTIAV